MALLPLSITKLAFCADQVSREKVGIEVTGLGVYRIVEPLVAYRMIDGDIARLSEILRDMFVGATRRIVANLGLEECMTHRKERVASALLTEIAPILAGEGSLVDTTRQGWGVVIDTIEIQNVRVLSEEVFGRLQAPFREKLALEALRAKEQVEEEQARIAIARRRTQEEARREIMTLEEDRLACERARQEESRGHEDRLARAALEAEVERQGRREEVELVRQRSALQVEVERAHAELQVQRARGELEAQLARAAHEAKGELSERQLEELVVTTMPQIAQAFRGSFDTINVVSSNGAPGELYGFLSAGLREVIQAARTGRRAG